MEVTKPYKFTGFGAIDVTKPYKFLGFGGGPDPLRPPNIDDFWFRLGPWLQMSRNLLPGSPGTPGWGREGRPRTPPKIASTFLANCCLWNPGWGTGPGTLTLLKSKMSNL